MKVAWAARACAVVTATINKACMLTDRMRGYQVSQSVTAVCATVMRSACQAAEAEHSVEYHIAQVLH